MHARTHAHTHTHTHTNTHTRRTGAFQLGMSFSNEMLFIYMPNQWNFCDFAFFTIWCEDFNQSFTQSVIPLDTWVSGTTSLQTSVHLAMKHTDAEIVALHAS